MTSPYQPPQHFQPPAPTSRAPQGLSWRGILLCALGLWLLAVMGGSVVTFVGLKFLGITLEDILDPSSTFQIWYLIILGSLEASLFSVVAARANSSPASDIGWVLLAYLILDASVAVLFLDAPFAELALWNSLSSIAAAALGYVLARLLVQPDIR